jgi:HlyD family secretion protein
VNWKRALLPIVLALAGCSADNGENLLGTLERDRLELIAESQEPIIEVAVREGDRVVAGQHLLTLDPASSDAQIEQAKAAVAQAEAALAEQVTGPRREEILAARARLASATSQADAAAREFERVAQLVERSLLPQSQLDAQRALRDGAAGERDAARQQLLELERGTRSEVLDQAQAALQQAEAQLAAQEIVRGRLEVVAPRAGVIDALPYKLGERPPRGAPVIVMMADGMPYARVFIPETLRSAVEAGTPALVRLDGSPRQWQAKVRYVSTDAAFTPYYALNEKDRSRLSFLAEVVLTEAEAGSLPTGMPVQVALQRPDSAR